MRPLISDQVNLKLNELVMKLFAGNRLCDRAMSQLDTKFAMNKTASLLHPKVAHLFPQLADVVSDYQSQRNNLTIYGATPFDATDYPTPLKFFEILLEFVVEVEALVSECCDVACLDNDFTTKVFLESFILKIVPLTQQCLLLVDKCELYGSDMMAFDHRIEDWIVL